MTDNANIEHMDIDNTVVASPQQQPQEQSRGLLENIQNFFTGNARPCRGRQSFYHTGQKVSMKIPVNVHIIYISACAAGGAGSHGRIDGGIIWGGNSGGSGSACCNFPIPVEPQMRMEIYVAGSNIEKDGESTIIELFYKKEKRRIVFEGGKKATEKTFGKGGKSPFSPTLNGVDGENGQNIVASSNENPAPADGAPSFFGSKCKHDTKQGTGFGFGACGVSVSLRDKLAKPGEGLVIIDW